jgi:hypothetical protein
MSLKTLLKTDLLVLGCLIGVAFFSCSDPRPDRSGLEQENKNREVKILKPTDVIDFSLSAGELVAKSLNENLLSLLQNNAELESCKLPSWNLLLDSTQILLINEVKRVGISDSTMQRISGLNKVEANLMEAYNYTWEENLTLENNLQKDIEKQSYLYSSVIYLQQGCLTCHQKQERAVGVWLINLNIKQVILQQ